MEDRAGESANGFPGCAHRPARNCAPDIRRQFDPVHHAIHKRGDAAPDSRDWTRSAFTQMFCMVCVLHSENQETCFKETFSFSKPRSPLKFLRKKSSSTLRAMSCVSEMMKLPVHSRLFFPFCHTSFAMDGETHTCVPKIPTPTNFLACNL